MRYAIYLRNGICFYTDNEKFVDSVIEAKNSGSDKPIFDYETKELIEAGEVIGISLASTLFNTP